MDLLKEFWQLWNKPFSWFWNFSQKEQKKTVAEKKAVLAATLQTQEDAQKAKEASVSPSESGQLPPKRRLPVGASVSSVNIDYEYFEVGTGQVRLPRFKWFIWKNAVLLLGFVSFNVGDFVLLPLMYKSYVYIELYPLAGGRAGRVG